jgi:hypothetical protein
LEVRFLPGPLIIDKIAVIISNQLNLFKYSLPVRDMSNEQTDASGRLKEVLELARKIETLTSSSKDSEDFN